MVDQASRKMANQVSKLKRIRNELADEIRTAPDRGIHPPNPVRMAVRVAVIEARDALNKALVATGESICPCGTELTDIRGEQAHPRQTAIDVDTKTEWRCQGCGARGHYNERGRPVVKESDSVRLNEMKGRLIGALSDRTQVVECLVECIGLLDIMDIDDWFQGDGKSLWCESYVDFEEYMRSAENALAEPIAVEHSG